MQRVIFVVLPNGTPLIGKADEEELEQNDLTGKLLIEDPLILIEQQTERGVGVGFRPLALSLGLASLIVTPAAFADLGSASELTGAERSQTAELYIKTVNNIKAKQSGIVVPKANDKQLHLTGIK
jgi:hypothetical protein